MMPKDVRKVDAVLDQVDVALDRIAEIPQDELSFEERLMLWAHLETLRLALIEAAQRCQRAAS